MAKKDTTMKLDRVEKLINLCLEGKYISAWEEGFLESLHKQLSRGRTLSPKQVDVIHRIESKVEKMRKGDPEWECVWDEEKAWNFKTAVTYYKESPERYFSQILDWFDQNKGKIPPQNYYKKIVENKYAQRILNGLRGDPKYPVGSTVLLRQTARNGVSYTLWAANRAVPLFVIEPTERAVSAAAGCRIYRLLSSVSSDVFEVEERWIKKWRDPIHKRQKAAPDKEDVPF
jgi:hypothetical protein